MALVKNIEPVVDNEVEVLAEIVQDINRKNKKCIFLPVHRLAENTEKDLLLRNRLTVKPPKNLFLVEEDPVEDLKVQRTRLMRNFPTEDLLSAKIRTANGTDYSNHSIEEHYNPRSRGKRKFKKRLKETATIDSSKKIKISLDALGPEVGSEKKEASLLKVIDLTGTSSAEETVGHIESDKSSSKLINVGLCPRLVPYSSSEDESDDTDEGPCSSDLDRDDSTDSKASRQHLISEGLNEEKFKFQNKSVTDKHKKKLE